MARGSLLGTTLADRFSVLELLGSGGMADVYLARHVVLGRDYAIKVIKHDIAADPVVAKRFRREAMAVSLFDHDNIVAISDFGCTADDRPYLVMEYVDGIELRALMDETDPDVLPARRSLSILAQLARALQAAHRVGVVHRDLKPENVILTQSAPGDDQLKVLDFGLAKIIERADVNKLTKLTRRGEIFGTPEYMAPEQSRAQEVDHRADIYSLGVMTYELCTGDLPFDYESIPRTLIAHQREDPPPPRRPDGSPLPSDLEAVILRCLAKNPTDRPADAGDVLGVLKRSLRPHRESTRMFLTPVTLPETAAPQAGADSRPPEASAAAQLSDPVESESLLAGRSVAAFDSTPPEATPAGAEFPTFPAAPRPGESAKPLPRAGDPQRPPTGATAANAAESLPKEAAPETLNEPVAQVDDFLSLFGRGPPNPDNRELGWQKATALGSELTRWLMRHRLAPRSLIKLAAQLYQAEERNQSAMADIEDVEEQGDRLEEQFHRQESMLRHQIIALSNERSEIVEQRGELSRLTELGRQILGLELELAEVYARHEPAWSQQETKQRQVQAVLAVTDSHRRELESQLIDELLAASGDAIPEAGASALGRLRVLLDWIRQ